MDAATQRTDFTRDAIAAFHAAHGYALPSKPRYTHACNHCGICCALSLCPIGEKAYPGQSAPCPALVVLEGQAKCGIVMMEEHVKLEPIVRKVLGIGCGCSMEDDDTTEEQAADFDARSRAMVFGHNMNNRETAASPRGCLAPAGSGPNRPMTIRDRIDGLEPDKWLMLENTPGAHRLMTAITRAGFSGSGRLRVRYEDCTEMEIEMPQWFRDVQVEKLTLLTFASAMSK